jgi:hypothetical protein
MSAVNARTKLNRAIRALERAHHVKVQFVLRGSNDEGSKAIRKKYDRKAELLKKAIGEFEAAIRNEEQDLCLEKTRRAVASAKGLPSFQVNPESRFWLRSVAAIVASAPGGKITVPPTALGAVQDRELVQTQLPDGSIQWSTR